jgi:hypothetical protein
MFDISTIDVADTFEVQIKHPKTGDVIIVGGEAKVVEGETVTVGGAAMSVTVYGPSSRQYRSAQSVASAKLIKRLRAKTEPDPDEDTAATAAFLSACTVSLNNFGYKGQSEGREAYRALYLDPKMGWLTEQVNSAMGDWANFTKASSTS